MSSPRACSSLRGGLFRSLERIYPVSSKCKSPNKFRQSAPERKRHTNSWWSKNEQMWMKTSSGVPWRNRGSRPLRFAAVCERVSTMMVIESDPRTAR